MANEFCWWEFTDDVMVRKCEPTEQARSTWWDWIVNLASTLGDIYNTLVSTGIISSGEADTMQGQGLTREEIAAIVDARIAAARPEWEKYLPWIITGGIGIGLILVLALRK